MLKLFHLRVEAVEVLRPFLTDPDDSSVLQDLQMMRNSRARKVGLFRNFAYPNTAALAHRHHFQDEMLPRFIAYRDEQFRARGKPPSQAFRFLIAQPCSLRWFKRLNQEKI